MELSNSTYNHFFLENTHFEFCMSTGPHTYQTRNPLPDRPQPNRHRFWVTTARMTVLFGYKYSNKT